MRALLESAWENVRITSACFEKYDNINFDESKKKDFETHVKRLEKQVRMYMRESSQDLDRHKMAAILIIAIVKAAPFSETQETSKKFMGNYVVATEIGLSYMLQMLNNVLYKVGEAPLDSYVFPKSWTCTNDYFRVFYRNLYFSNSNQEWGLNPLDIADKLFLLEYITLKEKGISVEKLELKEN